MRTVSYVVCEVATQTRVQFKGDRLPYVAALARSLVGGVVLSGVLDGHSWSGLVVNAGP